jgi:hypothetical protein
MGKSTASYDTYVTGSLKVEDVPSIVTVPPNNLPSKLEFPENDIDDPAKIVQKLPAKTQLPVMVIFPDANINILDGTAPLIKLNETEFKSKLDKELLMNIK